MNSRNNQCWSSPNSPKPEIPGNQQCCCPCPKPNPPCPPPCPPPRCPPPRCIPSCPPPCPPPCPKPARSSKMGCVGSLIKTGVIFGAGLYTGVYVAQNYKIEKVEDPKILFEKAQAYIKSKLSDLNDGKKGDDK